MKKYISGKGKFAASLLMAGMLAMSTVGAAFADSAAQGSSTRQGYFGNVTAKDESSFTVNTRANTEIELAVVQDTHFQAPGMPEASFDDLELGNRVAILADEHEAGLTAVKVMLVPSEPQKQHRVLTVVEASGNTVVAEDEQGNRVEVVLAEELNEELAGQLVTFVGERSQQSNRFKANAQVKIGQVVQRMEAHSQRLQGQLKDSREDKDRVRQERDLARIQERLQALMQQHVERFSDIIDRAPEQAKPHLEEALEMSLKGYRAALEALETPQDHIEASVGHRTVQGVVSGVDADAGKITLQTRGGVELTLDVTDDTRVQAEGRDLNLSDLSTGDLVTVKYNRDSSAAIEIRVKMESKAQGTIQSVDSANHRLTLELTDGTALTLTVTEHTKIQMNREVVSIDELPADSRVELEYNPATMEVLKIEVETQGEVEGTISSIDTEANTITILTEDGAELTLDITDNTRINIERILFGLTGLSEGMAVKVKYDSATEEALEIKAEHRRSNEKNTARATGTVTIRPGTR